MRFVFDRYGKPYEVDEEGNRIIRDLRCDWVYPNGYHGLGNTTKIEDPYGYSEFYHWREKDHKKDAQAVYDDRLAQWDRQAFARAHSVVPKRFDAMNQKDATKWMATYYEGKYTNVKVTALIEGCNVSNGYPYFVLWFRGEPVEKKDAKASDNSTAPAG